MDTVHRGSVKACRHAVGSIFGSALQLMTFFKRNIGFSLLAN